MAVQVKVDFDKAPANKALGEVQDTAAARFKELSKIAEESLKFEKIKAGLEGLKAFSEEFGPLLGDANKGVTQTLGSMAKLGDAGFKIGSIFGPIGGIIGGAVGAIGGFFLSASQKAAELKKQLEATQSQIAASREKIKDLDTVTIDVISAEIDKFREKLKGAGKEAQLAHQYVKELLSEGQADLADAFEDAATSADKAKEAIIGILKPTELTAEQAKEKLNAVNEEIAKIKGSLQDEGKVIRENNIILEEVAEKQQKRLTKELDKTKATLAEKLALQKQYATALKSALDQEAKDEEDATKKKEEARKKYKEKREKMLAEDSAKLSLITQDVIEDIEKEIAVNDDRIKAEEEWAETVKRVSIEVNQARFEAKERIREADKAEKERRAAELEDLKNKELQTWQEMKAGFENALAPLGQIVGATFGKITENIEKGNKAMKGVGLAAKGAVADVLKAFAKQWGAQALAELAAGLASLALGPVGGVAAAGHFAASAGFGAAAAAAGIGGALVARNVAANSSANSSSSSSAPSSSGGSPFLGATKTGGSGGTIIVQMNGNLFLGSGDDRSLEEPGRNLAKAIAVSSSVDQRIAA